MIYFKSFCHVLSSWRAENAAGIHHVDLTFNDGDVGRDEWNRGSVMSRNNNKYYIKILF